MKNPVIFISLCIILLAACKDELPEASFTHSAETYEPGSTVQFKSTSVNATAFKWDFGDGGSATEPNPSHIYSELGNYTVRLLASNDAGSDEAVQQVRIQARAGTLVNISVNSPGLTGNLLGDSPNRTVNVYLPPCYSDSILKSYPVVYFLHGIYEDHLIWSQDIMRHMNSLILEGLVDPMIVVSPNSSNTFMGSWYTNSTTTGAWEDFIVKDLVDYMDNNYRTIPDAESRGILGYSMGGYGALKLVMRYPSVFSTVYGMSSAHLCFEVILTEDYRNYLIGAIEAHKADELTTIRDMGVMIVVGFAATFAPDPEAPPTYGQYPITEQGEVIDSVWQKWLKHDTYSMLPLHKDSLMKLTAIKLCCGTGDDGIYTYNRKFSQKLNQHGINHEFESYEGDHSNKIGERIKSEALPFFHEHLKK